MATKKADKLEPKQEAAAIKFVECGNRSEAYRHAYNAENMSPECIWVEASRLFALPKVSLRVFDLQEANRIAHEVTVADIARELAEDRQLARDNNQASACVTATMGKAKLYGLITDKQDIKQTLSGKVEITINAIPGKGKKADS